MTKFVYKFFLIIFTVTANSFCTDNQIQKRFGCHNFSLAEKIANMNSITNELSRNLERCLRDTSTYNKENLDIAQKLNRDFVKADEERSYTSNKELKDDAAMMCLVAIHPITFDVCYPLFRSLLPPNDNDAQWALKIGVIATVCIFAALSTIFILKSKFDMRNAAEKKWLTIIKIKDFTDTLQKRITQDIQAAHQNK